LPRDAAAARAASSSRLRDVSVSQKKPPIAGDVDDGRMRLVVSGAAGEPIDRQGGRLYVWPKKARRCGGLTTLAISTTPPNIGWTPDELRIDVRRFPRKIEACWTGCACVT
jgi:hypothetical protein